MFPFSATLLLLLLLGFFWSATAALLPSPSAINASGLLHHTLSADKATDLSILSLEVRGDRQPDNETLAYYSKAGACFAYLGRYTTDYHEGWNRDKELEPCQTYCQKGDPSSSFGVRATSLGCTWGIRC